MSFDYYTWVCGGSLLARVSSCAAMRVQSDRAVCFSSEKKERTEKKMLIDSVFLLLLKSYGDWPRMQHDIQIVRQETVFQRLKPYIVCQAISQNIF